MIVDLREFSMMEVFGIAEKARGKIVALKMTAPHTFIVFANGRPQYASYRKVLGDEAFLAALLVESGEVEIVNLPNETSIRPNLGSNYEELLSQGEERTREFKMIKELIGDFRQVPVMDFNLKVEQICFDALQWKLVAAGVRGTTLDEIVDLIKSTEYWVAKAAVSLLERGAIKLEKPLERKAEPTKTVTRPKQTTPAAEKPIVPSSRLPGQPLVSKSETPKVETPSKVTVEEGTTEQPKAFSTTVPSDAPFFDYNVTVLPFTASMNVDELVDDRTLALNPGLYEELTLKIGSAFTEAYVLNPEKSDVEPILFKVKPIRDAKVASLTISAMLTLKAKNGQVLRIVPKLD
ncbi:hypothetical protein HPY42_04420 [Coprothermobacteraceae bacterium]|nr:hypothetical protein [Coprothermobacteraceae bacterium]